MYSIAIYNSKCKRGDQLAGLCKSIMKEKRILNDVQCFSQPERLFQQLHSFHMILIDLTIQPAVGLWLGRELRMRKYVKHIVFLCDCDLYYRQVLELHAFQYLYLPIHQELLAKALLDSYFMQNNCPYLILRNHEYYHRIPLKNIMYIESDRIYLFIHLSDEIIRYREKLCTLLEYLEPYHFIRCHQSYILNLQQIKKIEPYTAYMTDNRQIPISKAYSQLVRKAFLTLFEHV